MRNAFLATGMALLVMLPARGADAEQAAEDPWIGKTRAEVVQLLGKPQKVKRPGRDGEKLTYKFLRLDPSATPRLDVQLVSVPGVGIVAKATKAGSGSDTGWTIGPTEFDKHGRPTAGGVSVSQTASTSYDTKTGKLERSDSEASTGLGKVKLQLILDEKGRVTEWFVSGKK